MKRYLLFVGQTYYARGGMKDLHCAYDSLDCAASTGQLLADHGKGMDAPDWWHVFDLEKQRIVVQLDPYYEEGLDNTK